MDALSEMFSDEEEVEQPSASLEYQTKKFEQFQGEVDSSFTAMQTSFDYLKKTIANNPERILFDAENIIVLGNLATYTIPLSAIPVSYTHLTLPTKRIV